MKLCGECKKELVGNQRKWCSVKCCGKNWDKENPSKVLGKASKYRKNHPQKVLEGLKKWRKENVEYRKEYRKSSYIKNRERELFLATSWNREHPNEKKEIGRNFYKKHWLNDLDYRIKFTVRNRIRNALFGKRINKNSSSLKLLGIPIQDYRDYLEKKFSDGMDWNNYGKWHIDHIKPLSSFNLSDPKEQTVAFHFTNTQPLWARDNLVKSARFELSTS